ncbi:RnfABCDGE type electron transport complex subunit G [Pseudomonas sp. X10]
MSTGLRNAGVLVIVAMLALAITLICQHWTARPIANAEQQLKSRQWLAVLPDGSYDNQPLQQPLQLTDPVRPHSRLLAGYRATLQGRTSAIVLQSQVQGYGGPMSLLVAIDHNARLLGVHVLEHQETPGLGAQVADPASHWLQQFIGRDRRTTAESAWALKRDQGDFDQLASATVTSRAVISAVQDALRYFDEQRQTLLGEDAHE